MPVREWPNLDAKTSQVHFIYIAQHHKLQCLNWILKDFPMVGDESTQFKTIKKKHNEMFCWRQILIINVQHSLVLASRNINIFLSSSSFMKTHWIFSEFWTNGSSLKTLPWLTGIILAVLWHFTDKTTYPLFDKLIGRLTCSKKDNGELQRVKWFAKEIRHGSGFLKVLTGKLRSFLDFQSVCKWAYLNMFGHLAFDKNTFRNITSSDLVTVSFYVFKQFPV